MPDEQKPSAQTAPDFDQFNGPVEYKEVSVPGIHPGFRVTAPHTSDGRFWMDAAKLKKGFLAAGLSEDEANAESAGATAKGWTRLAADGSLEPISNVDQGLKLHDGQTAPGGYEAYSDSEYGFGKLAALKGFGKKAVLIPASKLREKGYDVSGDSPILFDLEKGEEIKDPISKLQAPRGKDESALDYAARAGNGVPGSAAVAGFVKGATDVVGKVLKGAYQTGKNISKIGTFEKDANGDLVLDENGEAVDAGLKGLGLNYRGTVHGIGKPARALQTVTRHAINKTADALSGADETTRKVSAESARLAGSGYWDYNDPKAQDEIAKIAQARVKLGEMAPKFEDASHQLKIQQDRLGLPQNEALEAFLNTKDKFEKEKAELRAKYPKGLPTNLYQKYMEQWGQFIPEYDRVMKGFRDPDYRKAYKDYRVLAEQVRRYSEESKSEHEDRQRAIESDPDFSRMADVGEEAIKFGLMAGGAKVLGGATAAAVGGEAELAKHLVPKIGFTKEFGKRVAIASGKALGMHASGVPEELAQRLNNGQSFGEAIKDMGIGTMEQMPAMVAMMSARLHGGPFKGEGALAATGNAVTRTAGLAGVAALTNLAIHHDPAEAAKVFGQTSGSFMPWEALGAYNRQQGLEGVKKGLKTVADAKQSIDQAKKILGIVDAWDKSNQEWVKQLGSEWETVSKGGKDALAEVVKRLPSGPEKDYFSKILSGELVDASTKIEAFKKNLEDVKTETTDNASRRADAQKFLADIDKYHADLLQARENLTSRPTLGGKKAEAATKVEKPAAESTKPSVEKAQSPSPSSPSKGEGEGAKTAKVTKGSKSLERGMFAPEKPVEAEKPAEVAKPAGQKATVKKVKLSVPEKQGKEVTKFSGKFEDFGEDGDLHGNEVANDADRSVNGEGWTKEEADLRVRQAIHEADQHSYPETPEEFHAHAKEHMPDYKGLEQFLGGEEKTRALFDQWLKHPDSPLNENPEDRKFRRAHHADEQARREGYNPGDMSGEEEAPFFRDLFKVKSDFPNEALDGLVSTHLENFNARLKNAKAKYDKAVAENGPDSKEAALYHDLVLNVEGSWKLGKEYLRKRGKAYEGTREEGSGAAEGKPGGAGQAGVGQDGKADVLPRTDQASRPASPERLEETRDLGASRSGELPGLDEVAEDASRRDVRRSIRARLRHEYAQLNLRKASKRTPFQVVRGEGETHGAYGPHELPKRPGGVEESASLERPGNPLNAHLIPTLEKPVENENEVPSISEGEYFSTASKPTNLGKDLRTSRPGTVRYQVDLPRRRRIFRGLLNAQESGRDRNERNVLKNEATWWELPEHILRRLPESLQDNASFKERTKLTRMAMRYFDELGVKMPKGASTRDVLDMLESRNPAIQRALSHEVKPEPTTGFDGLEDKSWAKSRLSLSEIRDRLRATKEAADLRGEFFEHLASKESPAAALKSGNLERYSAAMRRAKLLRDVLDHHDEMVKNQNYRSKDIPEQEKARVEEFKRQLQDRELDAEYASERVDLSKFLNRDRKFKDEDTGESTLYKAWKHIQQLNNTDKEMILKHRQREIVREAALEFDLSKGDRQHLMGLEQAIEKTTAGQQLRALLESKANGEEWSRHDSYLYSKLLGDALKEADRVEHQPSAEDSLRGKQHSGLFFDWVHEAGELHPVPSHRIAGHETNRLTHFAERTGLLLDKLKQRGVETADGKSSLMEKRPSLYIKLHNNGTEVKGFGIWGNEQTRKAQEPDAPPVVYGRHLNEAERNAQIKEMSDSYRAGKQQADALVVQAKDMLKAGDKAGADELAKQHAGLVAKLRGQFAHIEQTRNEHERMAEREKNAKPLASDPYAILASTSPYSLKLNDVELMQRIQDSHLEVTNRAAYEEAMKDLDFLYRNPTDSNHRLDLSKSDPGVEQYDPLYNEKQAWETKQNHLESEDPEYVRKPFEPKHADFGLRDAGREGGFISTEDARIDEAARDYEQKAPEDAATQKVRAKLIHDLAQAGVLQGDDFLQKYSDVSAAPRKMRDEAAAEMSKLGLGHVWDHIMDTVGSQGGYDRGAKGPALGVARQWNWAKDALAEAANYLYDRGGRQARLLADKFTGWSEQLGQHRGMAMIDRHLRENGLSYADGYVPFPRTEDVASEVVNVDRTKKAGEARLALSQDDLRATIFQNHPDHARMVGRFDKPTFDDVLEADAGGYGEQPKPLVETFPEAHIKDTEAATRIGGGFKEAVLAGMSEPELIQYETSKAQIRMTLENALGKGVLENTEEGRNLHAFFENANPRLVMALADKVLRTDERGNNAYLFGNGTISLGTNFTALAKGPGAIRNQLRSFAHEAGHWLSTYLDPKFMVGLEGAFMSGRERFMKENPSYRLLYGKEGLGGNFWLKRMTGDGRKLTREAVDAFMTPQNVQALKKAGYKIQETKDGYRILSSTGAPALAGTGDGGYVLRHVPHAEPGKRATSYAWANRDEYFADVMGGMIRSQVPSFMKIPMPKGDFKLAGKKVETFRLAKDEALNNAMNHAVKSVINALGEVEISRGEAGFFRDLVKKMQGGEGITPEAWKDKSLTSKQIQARNMANLERSIQAEVERHEAEIAFDLDRGEQEKYWKEVKSKADLVSSRLRKPSDFAEAVGAARKAMDGSVVSSTSREFSNAANLEMSKVQAERYARQIQGQPFRDELQTTVNKSVNSAVRKEINKLVKSPKGSPANAKWTGYGGIYQIDRGGETYYFNYDRQKSEAYNITPKKVMDIYHAYETGEMGGLDPHTAHQIDGLRNVHGPLNRIAFEDLMGLENVDKSGLSQRQIQNYVHHTYASQDNSERGIFEPGDPLKGEEDRSMVSLGQVEQRAFPTMGDAFRAGRLPKELNLADALTNGGVKFRRTVAFRALLGDLFEHGFGDFSERGPNGYERLDIGPDNSDAMKLLGMGLEDGPRKDVWVHPDVHPILKSLFAPGLNDKAWYRGMGAISHLVTPFKLGISSFHLKNTIFDLGTSHRLRQGMLETYGHMRNAGYSIADSMAGSLKQTMKSFTYAHNQKRGEEVLKAYEQHGMKSLGDILADESLSDDTKAVLGLMKIGQFNPKQNIKMDRHQRDLLAQAIAGAKAGDVAGNAGSIAFRGTASFIELLQNKVMNAVRRGKVGSIANDFQVMIDQWKAANHSTEGWSNDFIQQLVDYGANPLRGAGYRTTRMAENARRILAHADNVFGLVNYDSQYMKPELRHLLMLKDLAFGWKSGTGKIVARGMDELLNTASKIPANLVNAGRDLYYGENNHEDVQWDPYGNLKRKMGGTGYRQGAFGRDTMVGPSSVKFFVAHAALAAAVGAMMRGAGMNPKSKQWDDRNGDTKDKLGQELEELIFPAIAGHTVDYNGDQPRFAGGYMKEFWEAIKSPHKFAAYQAIGGLSPFAQGLTDAIRGTDAVGNDFGDSDVLPDSVRYNLMGIRADHPFLSKPLSAAVYGANSMIPMSLTGWKRMEERGIPVPAGLLASQLGMRMVPYGDIRPGVSEAEAFGRQAVAEHLNANGRGSSYNNIVAHDLKKLRVALSNDGDPEAQQEALDKLQEMVNDGLITQRKFGSIKSRAEGLKDGSLVSGLKQLLKLNKQKAIQMAQIGDERSKQIMAEIIDRDIADHPNTWNSYENRRALNAWRKGRE